MKTQALNVTTLRIKTVYVSTLIVIAIVLSLLTGCNKDDGPTPGTPPKEVPGEELLEESPPVPLVPILLDGIAAAPEELSKYKGQDLIYMLDKKSTEEGVIRVFTSRLKADTYRLRLGATFNPASPADKAARFRAEIRIFNEPNYRGYAFNFGLGETGLRNLATFEFDCGWFNNCHNINNTISSVKCQSMPYHYTILYRYANYRGTQLWIGPGVNRPNLAQFDFNDFASSIGFIPDSETNPQQ